MLRLGVCVLPDRPFREAAARWRRAEELGFEHAWTYDHITFSGIPDGPWYDAVTTLASAAAVTERIKLGTLVASPNFRHPVPFAQEIMSLDDASGGRFILGYGAGSGGPDARVLGYGPDGEGWSGKERGERYRESVEILDQLLRGAAEGRTRTTYRGTYYDAVDARMEPGCVQRPRVPFGLAATGPLGLRTVVKHAQMWIADDTLVGRDGEGPTAADTWAALERVGKKLDEVCQKEGRDPATLPRLLLTGLSPLRTMESKARFDDVAGRVEELGFTDFVVHYPRESGAYATPAHVLDEIAPANT
ncbi:LLM class flavin-dependent oxidoreductase [Catenulispora sp. NF23]|uniref:LLM class flavin-dependent oxidoreductase n=1 Tax=Catenulispora pinistramenti TaxID=2705254 RepID=A0ABS5KZD0_9ACTN|nr:LLM class flavin-dependent oxidoreductase [Catenulispora pinistramenti]MBS2534791.1 LLM class flavin-dependent oxidoreductase [Catenulispora pinistramenti]MBS2551442.1 LLM class flavin-dependent oxidoreductase [Catenulispora pinistramenti]